MHAPRAFVRSFFPSSFLPFSAVACVAHALKRMYAGYSRWMTIRRIIPRGAWSSQLEHIVRSACFGFQRLKTEILWSLGIIPNIYLLPYYRNTTAIWEIGLNTGIYRYLMSTMVKILKYVPVRYRISNENTFFIFYVQWLLLILRHHVII